jgi:hypothetical protein
MTIMTSVLSRAAVGVVAGGLLLGFASPAMATDHAGPVPVVFSVPDAAKSCKPGSVRRNSYPGDPVCVTSVNQNEARARARAYYNKMLSGW